MSHSLLPQDHFFHPAGPAASSGLPPAPSVSPLLPPVPVRPCSPLNSPALSDQQQSVAASVPVEPEPQFEPNFVPKLEPQSDFQPDSLSQLSKRTASCLPIGASPSKPPPKKQQVSGPFYWVGVSTRVGRHKAAEPSAAQARSSVSRRGKSTRQFDFEYNLTQAMQ